jgi:hypothetical protein
MCGFTRESSFSIVTEFVPGGSLWDFLRKRPRTLTPAKRTSIAYGISHGMRSLHRQGVLHRDLKSCNILLANGELVRIADFGLGKFVEGAQQMVTQAAGTAQWMAPEQIFTKNYGFPVDVYAFGTVLFELLTEQIPFHGLPQSEIYKILEKGKRPVIPPEWASTDLYWLIYRCWDHDPARRPTFEELCDEFETGVLTFPGSSPSELKPLIHYAKKKDGSWLWDARKFGIDVVMDDGNDANEEMFGAAANGDIQRFTETFVRTSQMDINGRDADGYTALHLAVMNGRPLMVTYLMGITGIDVNALTLKGKEPPVMLAVACRKLDCLQVLLENDATDVNRMNERGDALIHAIIALRRRSYWAAFEKSQKVADLTKKGADGKTPKQMATEVGWTDIAGKLPPEN